ncbi:MAG: type II pantothenate kinase [Clostridia bacterium]|nr:type II pantothenate kinase [Clostridia bacterium]
MKNIVIGIDVGGSTTKIVGFDISGETNRLIEPIFVRATDPITSIYGAFGKFTDINDLMLSDIARVMITGVGASYVTKDIYSLRCETIKEFRSIGLGGLYLSDYDKSLIVSMGTGTALVYAEKGKEPQYLGGTGVGGGTLLGLSKKLLDMDNVEHIDRLAREGDIHRVDLKISDITRKDIIPGFGDTMTASNFGKLSDLATKNDIALGLINMVFETIGMVSVFAARNFGIKNVVLTGNLTNVSQAKDVFTSLNSMFDMNFIIPENAQFGTVIGAALAGCELERNER